MWYILWCSIYLIHIKCFQVCGHRWRNTYERNTVDFMLGVCYCSKIEQNGTTAKGTYKLLPLLNSGNKVCYSENKINF